MPSTYLFKEELTHANDTGEHKFGTSDLITGLGYFGVVDSENVSGFSQSALVFEIQVIW